MILCDPKSNMTSSNRPGMMCRIAFEESAAKWYGEWFTPDQSKLIFNEKANTYSLEPHKLLKFSSLLNPRASEWMNVWISNQSRKGDYSATAVLQSKTLASDCNLITEANRLGTSVSWLLESRRFVYLHLWISRIVARVNQQRQFEWTSLRIRVISGMNFEIFVFVSLIRDIPHLVREAKHKNCDLLPRNIFINFISWVQLYGIPGKLSRAHGYYYVISAQLTPS